MSFLRYAVIGLALAAIAWPGARPDAAGPMVGAEWRVVELAGRPVEGAGTLRFAEGKASGKAACNSFFAPVKENGGLLRIGPVGATRMMCAGRMELEQLYFNTLGDVRGYRLDGRRLELTGATGAVLVVLES